MNSLGMMQPYFFPYLGYFDLISKTDYFVFFDTSKFQKRSWMVRNIILEPNAGTQYIGVPVVSRSNQTMADVLVQDLRRTKAQTLKKLCVYRNVAPNFEAVYALVGDVFDSCEDDKLCNLNINSVKAVCAYLGLALECEVFSEASWALDVTSNAPGDWALRTAEALGYSRYVNPSGGVELFDREKYRLAGVELEFTALPNYEYTVTRPFIFHPRLSIIDVLMWSSKSAVIQYIEGLSLQGSHG